MTAIQPERCDEHVDPLITAVEGRFGLEILDCDVASSTVMMSMPLAGLTNPFTAAPTSAPLAILIDIAAGRANHVRGDANEWTVSSELTLELAAGGDIDQSDYPADRVVATARAIGRTGRTSLAVCTLTCGANTIGCGTVRSYFISANRVVGDHPDESPRVRRPRWRS